MTQTNATPELEAFDALVDADKKRARRRGILIYGAVIAGMTTWFAFTAAKVTSVSTQLIVQQGKLDAKQHELHEKAAELSETNSHLDKAQELEEEVGRKVRGLLVTYDGLTKFMRAVTDKRNLRYLHRDVDWDKTQEIIFGMEPGPRQVAVLSAVIASWGQTLFKFGGASLTTGIDSPHFAVLVLDKAGVKNLPENTAWKPGDPRLSDVLINRFPKKTDTPEPGDLMTVWVSKGSGRFVTLYLGNGTCLGSDGSTRGFQIFDCESYVRGKGWQNTIEYRSVDYPVVAG
jgi:hypothetical protein